MKLNIKVKLSFNKIGRIQSKNQISECKIQSIQILPIIKYIYMDVFFITINVYITLKKFKLIYKKGYKWIPKTLSNLILIAINFMFTFLTFLVLIKLNSNFRLYYIIAFLLQYLFILRIIGMKKIRIITNYIFTSLSFFTIFFFIFNRITLLIYKIIKFLDQKNYLKKNNMVNININ
jgi:hypothetical protein